MAINKNDYLDGDGNYDLKKALVDEVIDEINTHLAKKATQTELGHIKLPENWIAPTLVNGWVNFGGDFEPCGFFKDEFGIVHLRGMVRNGTAGTPVFTLPEGYRPSQTMYLSTMSRKDGLDIASIINITSNGAVNTTAQTGTQWLTLASISFRV